ncbi:UbiA prenyltransferase family [Halenospora varia]|nr:UbiA prenyltransferase family [Halenospora varia]
MAEKEQRPVPLQTSPGSNAGLSTPQQYVEHFLPEPFHPYFELLRFDHAKGYWYFWLPHFYGTLIAAAILKTPLSEFLRVNLIHIASLIPLAGVVLTWNDLLDAPLDRQVERCKNRPIARGTITPVKALLFVVTHGLAYLWLLSLLPSECFLYAIPMAIGSAFYPLAKRVTHYPQVILGIVMGMFIFLGVSSLGLDPLALSDVATGVSSSKSVGEFMSSFKSIYIDSPTVAVFYLAHVVWVIMFEIIYSHMDARDDVRAGVKSIVLLFAKIDGSNVQFKTRPLLAGLAIVQVVLLSIAGLLNGSSPVYFISTVSATSAMLAVVVCLVDLHSPSNCGWWFADGNRFYVGWAIALGLAGEYARVLLE